MAPSEFRSLTPAQFVSIQDEYWERVRLEESFTALIVKGISDYIQLKTLGEGQKFENKPLSEFMTTPTIIGIREGTILPGWVKTVDGWVRKEDIQNYLGE